MEILQQHEEFTLGVDKVGKDVIIRWNIKPGVDYNEEVIKKLQQAPGSSGKITLSLNKTGQDRQHRGEGGSGTQGTGYFMQLKCLDNGVFTLVTPEVPPGSSTPVELTYTIPKRPDGDNWIHQISGSTVDPLMWSGVKNGVIGSIGKASVSESQGC